MKIDELLTVGAIAHADYDFEKCDQKDILTKMLENETPICVERFDSTGTQWDLWGEYYEHFLLYINGVLIETSSLISNFIEDFLLFLPHLAYTDDRKLICSFEYEGIITAFVTTPMDDDKIRVSIFYDRDLYKKYRPENKFEADIVIKKDTFIKQMYELLQEMVKDTKEISDKNNEWVNMTNYILCELDKYFENPRKYKNDYDPQRHVRVFDVAYKDTDNNWKFIVVLEDEQEANPMHWEREKGQGLILDYDIFERYPEEIYVWVKNYTERKRLTEKEIKEKLKPDMDEREENNWVFSIETKKWYAPNEVMPYFSDSTLALIHDRLSYEIKINENPSRSDDDLLKSYIKNSYDIDGELSEWPGYLNCRLILQSCDTRISEIEFNYRNNEMIREGLKKVANGKYARIDLGGRDQRRMHIWQYLYDNSESTDARDIMVACYEKIKDGEGEKELFSFTANREEFLSCFNNALNDIENRLKVTKHLMEVGEKLKIEENFTLGKGYKEELCYIEGFKGDYACVCKCLDGWGIINKNLEWVIKPEQVVITGKTHPKYGVLIKGIIKRFENLHNIDGKLFIAEKQDGKQFVIDINGDIKIPHVSDKIYYTYLNNELFFLAVEDDKTYIVNSLGEDLLTLDFRIGEKFWLFDDIVIVSKDDKYGLVDWKGKILIDFIFTNISPNKDYLDLIPVQYIDQWGYINKNGKVINMKIKG